MKHEDNFDKLIFELKEFSEKRTLRSRLWAQVRRPTAFALGVFLFVLVGFAFWPKTEQQKQQESEIRAYERELCRRAAACEKYSALRLECATEGNFKNCLIIKMGDEAAYIFPCSAYNVGGPAVLPPPYTPDKAACFLLGK